MRLLKNINWPVFILVNLLVVVSMILPFIPGPSNKLSTYLSMFVNAVGFIGLVLIPVGIFIALKNILRLKKQRETKFLTLGLYFIAIPIVALCTRLFIMDPFSNLSRDFAIKRSTQLITSIEQFKNKKGRYPETIDEIDRKVNGPFIMGIDRFRYTKYGDQYFLTFIQWPDGGVTEEIVLFGRQNDVKQLVHSEKYDYNNDIHRVMGAFASYQTSNKNWRYYLCD